MTDSKITTLGQSTYCDRVFRTSLFERDGYKPQIRVETFQLGVETAELILRNTLALRPGVAREVAAAISRGVDMLSAQVSK